MIRHRLCSTVPALLLLLAAACSPRSAPAGAPSAHASAVSFGPRTRAERSAYAETSSYADVLAFLDSLRSAGAPISIDTLGYSARGRWLPLVVASRPRVRTPAEARRLGRPILYVQANIHGGEVEGKEALLMLLRDLSLDPRPNVLDSVVLVAIPIYNADGNEALAPQALNREEQNGPEMVGERENGQGLDLNRDYVKAEAPETRASLRALAAWRPDLFADLHTTDGSFHGYAVTYAPPLNPASGWSAAYTRDVLLPELRRRVRARHGLETFDYGNFSRRYGADLTTDTLKEGWFTFDARPRFGTNYVGLRGTPAILVEAFSHDPFRRRVASMYAFVREMLSLATERGTALRNAPAQSRDSVAVRAALTTRPDMLPVIAEDLAADPDSIPDEPGVPRGLRRTGRFRTLRLPVFTRFEPTLSVPTPTAYLLSPRDTAALRLLALHGAAFDTLRAPRTMTVEVFTVDSLMRAERPFQGHREVTLSGRWRSEQRVVPAGTVRVAPSPLVSYLLEPLSDDGLTTWNVFDAALQRGAEFPVLRVP